MKFLFFLFIVFALNAQGQSSVKSNIENDLPYFSKYLGKELYLFLLDSNVKCFTRIGYIEEPPGRVSAISITIPNGYRFEVFTTYKYIDEYDFKRGEITIDKNWSLLCKEEIKEINIFKDGMIIFNSFKWRLYREYK